MQEDKSIAELSFEEALSELENIVQKIDTGEENLADAIANFERGMQLKKHCQQMLDDAKLKIEKIVKVEDEGGEVQTEEFKV